jgi:hypothetical protein
MSGAIPPLPNTPSWCGARFKKRRDSFALLFHFSGQVSFPLVLLPLNQQCTPPLRLQVSDCSTFLIMCHVRITALFCTEPIECFPHILPRHIFSPLHLHVHETPHNIFHFLLALPYPIFTVVYWVICESHIKWYWGSSILPRILDIGGRWRRVVSFKSQPLYPQGTSS